MAKATTIAESVKKIDNGSDPNEKVFIEIPLSEQEQDDWFCCVNGKTFQVQRGQKVLVPRFVKEVWENEKRMTEEAILRSRKLQQKLLDKEKAFG